MKVFLSSVVTGYESFRAAAADAVRSLGHAAVTAEDFPASTLTPQQACLAGVRAADLVVLLLGGRYGQPQKSGLSATHEEFEEAKASKPILAFVHTGASREAAQDRLVREVQDWAGGQLTGNFATADGLREAVTRAIHDYELRHAAGPFDESEAVSRATHKVQVAIRHGHEAALVTAISPGPVRQVIRPAELELEAFQRSVQQLATFGPSAVLDRGSGTRSEVEGAALWLRQDHAAVGVDQAGTVTVIQPATPPRDASRMYAFAIIEEDLSEKVSRSLTLAAAILQQIDGPLRLTHIAIALGLGGAQYLGWRTREEERRSPDQVSVGTNAQDVVVTLTPGSRRRAALTMQTSTLVEDLVATLRRTRRR